MSTAAVILAAGRGTRMRSDRAKVLHEMAGLPLVTWVVRAVRPLVDQTIVVVGHDREAVRLALAAEDVSFAVQDPQEGTGHALSCAASQLSGVQRLFVLLGDAPLIRTRTLLALAAEHEARGAAATVLTFRATDPAGYGRIMRTSDGGVAAIVEDAELSEEQRCQDEVNSGIFVFDAATILELLPRLPRRARGEYYLTDVVSLLVGAGGRVAAVQAPEQEAMGINTPEQLAAACGVVEQERADGRGS